MCHLKDAFSPENVIHVVVNDVARLDIVHEVKVRLPAVTVKVADTTDAAAFQQRNLVQRVDVFLEAVFRLRVIIFHHQEEGAAVV